MSHFIQLIHPLVAKLQPYLPGKSIQEVQERYQLKHVIKLASNENAWGCSQKVSQALKHLQMQDICLYPNTYLHPFFQTLQTHLQLPSEAILVSNGSDAIFSLLMQAFALPQQKSILTHQYAFMGYATQANALGLECHQLPINEDTWEVDCDQWLKYCRPNTGLIFLANPNNPTGVLISWSKIEFLLQHLNPDILLIIDEAYQEYIDVPHPHLATLLARYPNLILTRTLSKAYGLAGLRIGYAMGNPEIIEILKKIQLPFCINQVALTAADAALKDQAFLQQVVSMTRTEKQALIQALQNLPLKLRPTEGNFITLGTESDVTPMVEFLEQAGIIVRPLHRFGLPHYTRITIGQHEQNKQLIKHLHDFYRPEIT